MNGHPNYTPAHILAFVLSLLGLFLVICFLVSKFTHFRITWTRYHVYP